MVRSTAAGRTQANSLLVNFLTIQYMTAVQLQKIEHAFGSHQLLRGLDLEVASGEYLVLLGRSGCGKTTLLRAIAGLLRPNGGQIRFDGQSVTNLPPRRRKVAFVFQHDALYPHLTVRGSIRFSLRNQDGLGAIDPRIDRAAELTGIANLLDRFPDQLSGGERRRCALAKAVASGNRLRLLDEPLSALDAPLRFSLQEDILRWHQSDGGTTIHVT